MPHARTPYLRDLRTHLAALDPADAEEVLREIESHLDESLAQAQARGAAVDEAALLQGFGPADALAAQYVAHVQRGAPPPRGFRVIQRVRRTATRGLYWSVAVSGYAMAAVLAWLGLAKLMDPAAVGLWSASHGEAAVLSWHGAPDFPSEELLGYALVPIALLAAAWCAELTRRVLRVLRRAMA